MESNVRNRHQNKALIVVLTALATGLPLAGNVAAQITEVTEISETAYGGGTLAVNPTLNKIYASDNGVTAIDGTTFAVSSVGSGWGVLNLDTSGQYWAGGYFSGTAIVRDATTRW